MKQFLQTFGLNIALVFSLVGVAFMYGLIRSFVGGTR
jgi:hypothetical protein